MRRINKILIGLILIATMFLGIGYSAISNITLDITGTVTAEASQANPYIPTGFSEVAGTSLETGFTIQDGSGNQYVWVEVPKTAEVYPTAGLSITEFTETELGTIETDLHTYTATYRNSTSYTDTWYSSAQHGFASSDDYNALKYKMLKSVYQNGGFYVGKYEVGTEGSYRTSSSKGSTTNTPVIKENAYPYTYVTCSEAQTLATSMASGEYTSSLMFGVQWDLVLRYLETKGATQSALNSDSTSWGNYQNNNWTITNTSSKYTTNPSSSSSTWTSGAYGSKGSTSTSILLSTGADSSFSKQGIYDIAGNVYEWTMEYASNPSSPCANRGGFYYLNGSYNPASYRNYYSTTYANYNIGFRVTLY